MEYAEELNYIDKWYCKLKGTEYTEDYSETRFFKHTSVSITVTKEILKKFNPKEEKYIVRGVVKDDGEQVITVTYIL